MKGLVGLWRYVGTAEQAISPHVRELWREAEARGMAVLDVSACGIRYAVCPDGRVFQLVEG
ncbi:MAG: hypothetical protein ACXQT3_02930 [Methermicoccaceae archaeon]